MRSTRFVAMLSGVVFPFPAWAGPLVGATLSLQLGNLPPALFAGASATGTATSELSATLDAGTAFSGVLTTTLPITAAPPFTQVQVIASQNGALSFTGGSTPGAFVGIASVKCCGGLTLLDVPLKIGVSHTTSQSMYGVNLTTIGGEWTVGASTLTLGPPSSPSMTVMATGANSLSANGAGSLTLVSPVKIVWNISDTLAGFGVLTLTYVPEPGTLALLAGGVLALAALGMRSR